MEIRINSILERLSQFSPEARISDGSVPVKYAGLLEKNQKVFDPGCIYIGPASYLTYQLNMETAANIICIEDRKSGGRFPDSPKLNLIIIGKSFSMAEVFNRVQDEIVRRQRLINSSKQLLDYITEGKGIQQIIKLGYKLIGNPMCIIDTNFRLLAFTRDIGTENLTTKGKTPKSYFTYETVLNFKNERIGEKIFRSRRPVLINSKAFDKRSIAANIVIDNRIVGYLIVVEMEKPFEEDDIELIDLLNSVVSLEMKKDQFISSTRASMQEHFLADILDGKIKGGKAIREKLKSLDWNMEGRMRVITVLVKEQDAVKVPMFYVRDVLGSMFSRSICIVYNNNIVIFLSHKSDNIQFENELKYLASFLEDNEMRCAVSRAFDNPAEIRKNYIQTLKCLELGSLIDKDGVVLRYEDYVLHHILSCCMPQVNLMDFCHPLVLELMEYDRENNTDYTLSLYMYIKNGRKKIETANELHIHRNTMSYRIERIMKILNVDLDDSSLIFQFLITFKILEYLNESGFADFMVHPRSAL